MFQSALVCLVTHQLALEPCSALQYTDDTRKLKNNLKKKAHSQAKATTLPRGTKAAMSLADTLLRARIKAPALRNPFSVREPAVLSSLIGSLRNKRSSYFRDMA